MFTTDKEFIIEKESAMALFNRFIEEYDFNSVIDGKDIYDWKDAFVDSPLWKDYSVYSGACRAVVVPRINAKYVYKIDRYRDDDEIHYCENEAHVYQEAINRGIERAFCPVLKLFTLTHNENHLDIYIAPYCDIDNKIPHDCYEYHFKKYCEDCGYDINNLTDAERDDIECSIANYYDDADGVLEFAAEEWPDELFVPVSQLIESYGINDLHSGNWGYLNGCLVITDYAGYNKVVGSRTNA